MTLDTLTVGHTPRMFRLQVVQGVEKEAFTDQIKEAVDARYENAAGTGDASWYQVDEGRFGVEVESLEDFTLLTSIIEYDAGLDVERAVKNGMQLFEEFDSAVTFPSPAFSTFVVFAPIATDEAQASALVDSFSRQLSRLRVGVGVVRGCLFSILESKGELEQFDKYYAVSPIEASLDTRPQGFDETMEDIKKVAVCSARLSQLHRGSMNFFSALKPGEGEISERTEGFLWNLMRPEPLELETLESWLGYIVEREASLSAMIAVMRGNMIEAQLIVSRIEDVFRRLNETSLRGEPTSLDGETRAYNRLLKAYEDYLVRSEALKARLGTVMDSVRTYLSIQQQRLTLEEQKASKEQLVRLVGLQETFHKIEIFILAVYMTEMAKIVFEVVAEHEATLLTAIFIPVALLLAVGVSRFLHRE
ncbi:hypothetical protein JXL21_01765 [Candidatus Bathyarchaeota archaeon]|nr:hypothetical protein [Candidatus Bathyarchaeota archaeon]